MSTGVSSRAMAAKAERVPSGRSTSTVTSCRGRISPPSPRMPRVSRPVSRSDSALSPGLNCRGQAPHPPEVAAVEALVALGDDDADAEQQRALGRPVARGAAAVFLAREDGEGRARGLVALGGVGDVHLLPGGDVGGA